MAPALLMVGLLLGLVKPVHAKWPTIDWVITEKPNNGGKAPIGERATIAEKHRLTLQSASNWYQSMSFPAPYQINERRDLTFKDNERYLAYLRTDPSNPVSVHSSAGWMGLSTHKGFLNPQTPNDRIYQAASVHELFHGIQLAYPSYRSWASRTNIKKLHGCDPGERANDWLTEGTASAVQIQYLERQNRQHLNHPFHGPSDIRWTRTFDQPLHWPRLSEEQSVVLASGLPYSWQCSYGTWYFWYAVGNMLGSPDPLDTRRTSYLHHVFSQNGPWTDAGLAMVDLGLKHAAAAMDALRPYHGGLYALYPQFVAQYRKRTAQTVLH